MSMILLDRCDSELKCLDIRGKTDEGCDFPAKSLHLA